MTEQRYPILDAQYVPDFRDLFEAGAQLRTRRYRKSQMIKLNALAFVLMIGGGFLCAITGVFVHRWVPSIPSYVVTIVLFLLLGLAYGKLLVPWMTRQSADWIRDMRQPGPMRVTSSDEGLRWQDADIDFQLRWSGVEAIYCTEKAIAFMSGIIALVLPFSAFPDTATRDAFIRDALAAIPEQAAATSRADKSLRQILGQ